MNDKILENLKNKNINALELREKRTKKEEKMRKFLEKANKNGNKLLLDCIKDILNQFENNKYSIGVLFYYKNYFSDQLRSVVSFVDVSKITNSSNTLANDIKLANEYNNSLNKMSVIEQDKNKIRFYSVVENGKTRYIPVKVNYNHFSYFIAELQGYDDEEKLVVRESLQSIRYFIRDIVIDKKQIWVGNSCIPKKLVEDIYNNLYNKLIIIKYYINVAKFNAEIAYNDIYSLLSLEYQNNPFVSTIKIAIDNNKPNSKDIGETINTTDILGKDSIIFYKLNDNEEGIKPVLYSALKDLLRKDVKYGFLEIEKSNNKIYITFDTKKFEDLLISLQEKESKLTLKP